MKSSQYLIYVSALIFFLVACGESKQTSFQTAAENNKLEEEPKDIDAKKVSVPTSPVVEIAPEEAQKGPEIGIAQKKSEAPEIKMVPRVEPVVAPEKKIVEEKNELMLIKLSQDKLLLKKGVSVSVIAQGYYSNGTVLDITNSVDWSADNPEILDVGSEKGTFIGLKTGKTVVNVQKDGVVVQMDLMVLGLVSLVIEELPELVYTGQKYQLRAMGTYNDASIKDVTEQAVWRLDQDSLGTMENIPGAKGLFMPTAAGDIKIMASHDDIEGTKETTAADVTLTASLSVGGDSLGPVGISLNDTATIVWEVGNATSCRLKKGLEDISAVASGTITLVFTASETVALECKNIIGESIVKSIDAQVFGSPTVSLAVGGIDTSPVKIPQGSSKVLSWSSTNAETCSVMLGELEISDEISGTVEHSFHEDATVLVECANPIGIRTSKNIVVDAIEAPSVTLTLNNKDASPQTVIAFDNYSIEWTSSHASTCTLKDGSLLINSSLSGSMTRDFSKKTNLNFECKNILGLKDSKSIAIEITALSPIIKNFSIEGDSVGPVGIAENSSASIVWDVINATSCKLTQGTKEITIGLSGSIVLGFATNETVSLACENYVGEKISKNIAVNVYGAPSVSLAVGGLKTSPLQLPQGTSKVISWSSTNAASCSLMVDGAEVNSQISGSLAHVFSKDATVLLECTNAIGKKVSKSMSVDAVEAPLASLTVDNSDVSSQTVTALVSYTLKWTSSHATACTLKDGDSIIKSSLSGSMARAFSANTVLSFECENILGIKNTKSIALTVTALSPKIATFSVAGDSSGPVSLSKNASSSIVWEASNATACSLKKGTTTIGAATSGSTTKTFAANAIVALECENILGEKISRSIQVNVFAEPSVSLAVDGKNTSPIKVAQGTSKAISWSSTNATSCSLKVNGQAKSSQTSGSISQVFSANATILLECANAIGVKSSKSFSVDAVAAPSVNLTINGNGAGSQTVTALANQTLAWTSSHATACTLRDGGSIIKSSLSGSMSRAFSANTTLKLECQNILGVKSAKTISLTVTALSPVITAFSVGGDSLGPVNLSVNAAAAIVWGSSNATVCSLKKGAAGISSATSGTKSVAFSGNTLVSLECENILGEKVAKSIQVNVFAAPSVTLTVWGKSSSPVKVAQGTSKTISWSSTNATSCSLKVNGQVKSSQMSGSISQLFSADATVLLECANILGVKTSKSLAVDAVEKPTVNLTINGDSSSSQTVTASVNKTLAWTSKYATACTLKDGGSLLKSSISGSMTRAFSGNTVLAFECQNSLGIKSSKSISLTVIVPNPVIKKFEVGGVSTSPVKLNMGDSRYITWNTANASSCFVKDGGTKISTAKSGSIQRTFKLTRDVYIECQNSVGKKVSKTLQVLTNMVGNVDDKVSGYYDNPLWGEMVIRVEGTKFRATYNYYKGTVKGTYNPTTGYVTAYWCEVYDGVRGGVSNGAEGQAQFVFVKDHSTGKIRLDGKWRNGSSGTWVEDWDLDLITSPNSTQLSIKSTLDQRFSQSGVFCGSY